MSREELLSWIADSFGVAPEYPWDDRNAVLRHGSNRKWFAAVLEVGREKLGLPGDGVVDVVNVKCDPRMIGSLLTQPGYHRAYHMNKEKWISLRLDGSVPAEALEMLVSLSYELTGVRKKQPKKERIL